MSEEEIDTHIWRYSIEELESFLVNNEVTVTAESPRTTMWKLNRDGAVYSCTPYRNGIGKGTQYGASLTELLLRSVFGNGAVTIQDKDKDE